jgi:ATP-dependent DNA ligase
MRQGLAVSYMLFDVLVHGGRSILQEPLQQRRERLRELLAPAQDSLLRYSASVIGKGREFFAQAVAQGHEGIMAKRLDSRYLPGQRSPAWRKIKPAGVVPCVVIGYMPDQHEKRMLLATLRQGQLQYVGPALPGRRRPRAGNRGQCRDVGCERKSHAHRRLG